MRNKAATQAVVRKALATARYEVLPTAKVEQTLVDAVPRDVTLTVTASPAKGIEATLDLTSRLVAHGYRVVPHLAARMISGNSELTEIADRLVGIGVTNVFCPAGDADPPAGEYAGSLAMLEHLTQLGRPFAEVGITGYPESHPAIEDDVTIQSMWDKRQHATYVVSNLCFDSEAIGGWLGRMRRRGITLPVLLGLPGPVERAKLVSMAAKVGVGQSVRFLKSHATTFARIAVPGGFSPERFLQKSAPLLTDPALQVRGLHLFTFNQVAETEAWRQEVLGRTDARSQG
ncbi:MAG: methylenetetrahydrofolate reductase [Nocardioidaceae bacterium]|nr:methylenetetrahydrofolate reductase [Nocardioidaceae bacterium]